MIHQRTVRTEVSTAGVGLHLGQKVELAIRPAPPNSGIVFRRNDLPGSPAIRALAGNVTEVRLATCIEADGAKVSTIEHLMAAFAGLGIDNAEVWLSSSEVPIMDGSAAPFVFLIQSVGVVEQAAPKRFLRVLRAVSVEQGDKWARVEPHHGFRVAYEGRFEHPAFANGPQSVCVDFSQTSFLKEVSRARTFGFTQEVEALRSQGLALGGSLDNAIVMDEFRVLNADGLRYADEFLKHKILDALGDLYLLGAPLIGAFSGYKTGHALNNLLARALLADPDAWETVTFAVPEEAPAVAFTSLQPAAA
jgi:UDP-3-O-[3-hydroxymyristoyl] N-acetylglucosamine deacetylase